MVDECGGIAECPEATGRRTRRIDHHAGAEFVVAAEITVDVAGEHQRHHRATRPEPADLQSAVVDQPLSGVGLNGEHRGMHVGFADPNGHREYGSGNGVLGNRHAVTVMRGETMQDPIVEGYL